MKTTIMYFIITVKTQSAYFIIALLFAMTFSSCQPEEVAPVQPRSQFLSLYKKKPSPDVIPPDEVIRTVYAGATKWQITYNNYDVNLGSLYQRYLNTIDGSLQNLAQLQSRPETTAQADLNLSFYFVESTDKYDHLLTYPASALATRFKPAEFGTWQLAAMTVGNPAQFQSEFENSTFEATRSQPYNYELNGDESDYLQEGDIFLFKTDRRPARYGAIYIKEKPNYIQNTKPFVIEVTVQADNNIVELGQ
jgi:hypothetical protein